MKTLELYQDSCGDWVKNIAHDGRLIRVELCQRDMAKLCRKTTSKILLEISEETLTEGVRIELRRAVQNGIWKLTCYSLGIKSSPFMSSDCDDYIDEVLGYEDRLSVRLWVRATPIH